MGLLCSKRQSLRYSPRRAPTLLHCGAVCGGGVREGTTPLAKVSAGFQSLSLLPISKLGPSGGDSRVNGFVYVLGPCGSLQGTLLWGWEFFLPRQPPQVFTTKGFKALFPSCGSLSSMVCLAPQLLFQVIRRQTWGHCLASSGPPTPALPILSTLAAHLCLSYWSGWILLLELLGCWTSIQFTILAVPVIFCF